MDIIPILKLFAEDLTIDNIKVVQSVLFGNDFEANIASKDTIYPMCQIVPILSSSINIGKFGSSTNQWEIFVFFCNVQPKGIESNADDNNPIIVAMRDAGTRYAANLANSIYFQPLTKINFQTLFFKYDALVSGVLVNFSLQEKQPFRIC